MLDIHQYDPHSPKQVDDIVGNGELWKQLHTMIRTDIAPHIVLCGPAGCGKSLFLRLALTNTVLTLDCTANSGLRDLRDNLRGFARGSRTSEGHFRWVVLEHADALTADTQAFLRRMMETTSNTTRIVFECRDAGAIAEPIFSRSTLYAVNAPDETEVKYEAMRRTDFLLDSDQVNAIVQVSNGNMRKVLMNVLARRWNQNLMGSNELQGVSLASLLQKRPSSNSDREWTAWAIETEQACRNNGYDLRDVLQLAWPNNSHVFYICSQWPRLGGMSPRAFFFQCISRILRTPA